MKTILEGFLKSAPVSAISAIVAVVLYSNTGHPTLLGYIVVAILGVVIGFLLYMIVRHS